MIKMTEEEQKYIIEMSDEYDSEGNQLTKAQADFFKDSKVRDSQGRLLVCYHGSQYSFDKFSKTADWGYHFGTEKAATDRIKRKFFIKTGTETVYKCYLNVKHPIRFIDMQDWTPNEVCFKLVSKKILTQEEVDKNYLDGNLWDIRKYVVDKGYDGVIYKNRWEDKGSVSYTAFLSNQIKSVSNKTPTNSNNINETWDSINEKSSDYNNKDKKFIKQFNCLDKQNVVRQVDGFKSFLDQNHFCDYTLFVDLIDFDRYAICCYIDWGNWKHEHNKFDYLAQQYFKETIGYKPYVNVKAEETDESDCYCATHIIELDQCADEDVYLTEAFNNVEQMKQALLDCGKFHRKATLDKMSQGQIFKLYMKFVVDKKKSDDIELTDQSIETTCEECGALLLDDKSCPHCDKHFNDVEHPYIK